MSSLVVHNPSGQRTLIDDQVVAKMVRSAVKAIDDSAAGFEVYMEGDQVAPGGGDVFAQLVGFGSTEVYDANTSGADTRQITIDLRVGAVGFENGEHANDLRLDAAVARVAALEGVTVVHIGDVPLTAGTHRLTLSRAARTRIETPDFAPVAMVQVTIAGTVERDAGDSLIDFPA